MPKRVVDGEGIWGSDRILALKEEYQAEYANLIPLAEANGVFEADPHKIWSRVYAFNRRSITVEFVSDMLADMAKVGLLLTWEDKGKIWGFWEGNQKAGRLPKPSELKKYNYQNLPPSPPAGLSGDSADIQRTFRPCIGLVSIGLVGSGLEPAAQENEESLEDNGQGESMKLKNELTKIAASHGAKAGGYKTTWDEIKSLGVAYGTGTVATDFASFMEEYHGDDFPSGAVVAYLRCAADRLTAFSAPATTASKDPAVTDVIREIAYLSDGKVTFQGRHKVLLADLLQNYSSDELLSVFRTFLENKDLEDPYTLKYITGNYLDAADGLAYAARKRKQETEKERAARDATSKRLQEEAEAERQRLAKTEAEKEPDFDPLAE